jgi:hypothetical protein
MFENWDFKYESGQKDIEVCVSFTNKIDELLCPTCHRNTLKLFSKYKRHLTDRDSVQKFIMLRRFKCTNCGKTHVELLPFLIPYKRHVAATVELNISEKIKAAVKDPEVSPSEPSPSEPLPCDLSPCDPLEEDPLPSDERTKRHHWKWFDSFFETQILPLLRRAMSLAPFESDRPVRSRQDVMESGDGWLRRLVRRVVNSFGKFTQTLPSPRPGLRLYSPH